MGKITLFVFLFGIFICFLILKNKKNQKKLSEQIYEALEEYETYYNNVKNKKNSSNKKCQQINLFMETYQRIVSLIMKRRDQQYPKLFQEKFHEILQIKEEETKKNDKLLSDLYEKIMLARERVLYLYPLENRYMKKSVVSCYMKGLDKYFSEEIYKFESILEARKGVYTVSLSIPQEYKNFKRISESDRNDFNKRFIEKELEECDSLLSDIDGRSLDYQQRKAVITDEDNNLVIAGAGSGKTLTIAAKAKYLVERIGIDPGRILLITFTKKAAQEMRTRVQNKLGLDVVVRTFHSLGMNILKNSGMDNLTVKNYKVSHQQIKTYLAKDQEYANKIFRYLALYSTDIITEADENVKNKNEYFHSLKSVEPIKGKLYQTYLIITNNLKVLFVKKQNKKFSKFNKDIGLTLISKAKKMEEIKKYISLIPEEYFILDEIQFNQIVSILEEGDIRVNINSLEEKYCDYNFAKNLYKDYQVKSEEERIIANFLFLNGIDYVYERGYYPNGSQEFMNPDGGYSKGSSYHPDFYLPEYNLYIEHFGVNKDLKSIQYSEEENRKYEKEMEWKIETHKLNDTKLLTSYSYYHQEGNIISKLEENLINAGVELKPISNEEINMYLQLLEKAIDLESLVNLINTFIGLFKSNNFKMEKIQEFRETSNRTNEYIKVKHNLFFDILEPMFELYNTIVQGENIDFNDMINKSTDILNLGEKNKEDLKIDFDYIIIDEFQDTSVSRFKLVDAIRNITGASIMAVGDDWQSIYRFAGSDINLFTEFSEYFGATEKSFIEKTYRNSQNLIDISGKFVMKNSSQIQKNLKSDKQIEKPVQIYYIKPQYQDNEEDFDSVSVTLAKILQEIESSIRHEGKSEIEVLLLGRNKNDIYTIIKDGIFHVEEILASTNNPNKTVNKEALDSSLTNDENEDGVIITDYKIVTKVVSKRVKLRYNTVHSSKGLEADEVVILNITDKNAGFPNKLVDDSVLQYVLAKADLYPFGEERRLFYVALTRTKNKVYLFSPENSISLFVNELVEDHMESQQIEINKRNDSNITDIRCSICGGKIVNRTSFNGNRFGGCENFKFGCKFMIEFSEDAELEVALGKNPERCPICNHRLLKSSFSDDFYCANYERKKSRSHYKIAASEYYFKVANYKVQKDEYELKREIELKKEREKIKKVKAEYEKLVMSKGEVEDFYKEDVIYSEYSGNNNCCSS